MADSDLPGAVQLIDNHFGTAFYATTPVCELEVPYEYQAFLDETADVPAIVTGELVSAVVLNPKSTANFRLTNYPNPFNPITKIRFTITRPSPVNLIVVNLNGQQIETLIDDYLKPGDYSVDWDATGFAAGIYFYQLKTAHAVKVGKMLLLK